MTSARFMTSRRAAESGKPEAWADRRGLPFMGLRIGHRGKFRQRRETSANQRRETVECHRAGASAPASMKGKYNV